MYVWMGAKQETGVTRVTSPSVPMMSTHSAFLSCTHSVNTLAGTTALYDALALHPQIRPAEVPLGEDSRPVPRHRPKEIHFWADRWYERGGLAYYEHLLRAQTDPNVHVGICPCTLSSCDGVLCMGACLYYV
jgi:hypothetical protein